ncbi:baseplate [Enterobacter hormaechei]|uniref:baseplate n=1 Tax=Enterobacter hormaechei TaxID=158836 RepID=UPI00115EC9F8|nr:baseplate [Enterobacter hormaechei]
MSDNRQILSRTGEWKTSKTGKLQTTGFDAVDDALANLISKVFDNVLLVEPSQTEQRFQSFLSRPAAERIYVGRFDSVIECLKAIRRANAGQGRKPDAQSFNPDALPLINISRSMDISYDNNDQQVDRRIGSSFNDPADGRPLAELKFLQAILTYDVTIMATDKDTLGLMCNTLGASIRLLMSTQFEANTHLVRVPVPLICALQDAKEIGFSDVSAPLAEERIYAAQAPISVLADVITAFEVDATRVVTEAQMKLG